MGDARIFIPVYLHITTSVWDFGWIRAAMGDVRVVNKGITTS